MTKAATKTKSPGGVDKRRSKRTDILDTFSLFAVVPSKGPLRLRVHDISELGIGFDLDIEEEQGVSTFQVKVGSSFDMHLYLNQSLYLPLSLQIRRIVEAEGGIRRIGAEFQAQGSPQTNQGYKALLAFLNMLDAVSEVAKIES